MTISSGTFAAATGKNGTFIAAGNGGAFVDYTSHTGVSVTLRAITSNFVGTLGSGLKSIVVGDSGTILLSGAGTPGPGELPNWTSFTSETSGTSQNLYGVEVTNTVGTNCVAVGAAGTILFSSTGGTSWSSETSGTVQDLNSVCWDDVNSTWVAVGNSGVILTSTNGTTWTSRTSGTSNNLYKALYNNTTIGSPSPTVIVVGAANTILKTTNDTTWTAI